MRKNDKLALPEYRVDFVLPVGVEKFDEKSADDNDDWTESITKHV